MRYIVNLFERHSVGVVGMKGTGKDMLMSNVVVRRGLPYISNTDYGTTRPSRFSRLKCIVKGAPSLLVRFPLDLEQLSCGGNTYRNFLTQSLNRFLFPYPDYTDVYIGDAGVYFPAQYCNELNKHAMCIPTFEALSRHLGECKVHFNCQNLNRVWDKIREHSDVYLLCRFCKVLFGKIVIQVVTEYDKYESCVARINPCRVRVPLFNKQARMQALTYIDNFYNTHGRVRNRCLIYINKAKYDTRAFKRKLEVAVDD